MQVGDDTTIDFITGGWPPGSCAAPGSVRVGGVLALGLADGQGDGSLLTVGADDIAFLAGRLVALDLPFEALEPPALVDLLGRAGARLSSAHPSPPCAGPPR